MSTKCWTQEELKAKFKQIGPKPAAAIALRAALRVFPFLAVESIQQQQSLLTKNMGKPPVYKNFLWFWQKNADQHLLAVLRAYDVALTALYNPDAAYVAYVSRAAAADACADAAAYAAARAARAAAADACAAAAAYAAARAARAAAYVLGTAADDEAAAAYAAAARAVRAVRAAADFNPLFLLALNNDLQQVENNSFVDLIALPLWEAPSNTWVALWDVMHDQLSQFEGGSFAHWIDWYQARLDGSPIDPDLQMRRAMIPDEIKSEGVKAINAYLAGLVNAERPLNKVRALFIGYGESGKTSLIRALHGEDVADGEPMTAGIEIRDWPVDGTEIKADLWDFGGQVMAHASHQFFLRSRCVYVVVLNSRKQVADPNSETEYWLEHVKAFGDNAPVLIVANKADQGSVALDMTRLRAKYPNIVGLYEVSCTQYKTAYQPQFDIFREAFVKQLQAIGTHTVMFNNAQFQVLQKLSELSAKHTFLPQSEYQALCEEAGIQETDVQNREWLLDLMDKLGVVLHFPKMMWGKKQDFLLNPQWLTYGVNALIFANEAHGGRLRHQEIETILQRESKQESVVGLEFPVERCGFIVNAMKHFELAYSISDDQIIMPALLPSETPAHGFDKSADCLVFEYTFDTFLPRNVMANFIVRRHEQIVSEATVWELGVYLRNRDLKAEALVEVDYQKRNLMLWVKNGRANAYMTMLLDDVNSILGRMKSLDYAEWVWLAKTCLLDQQDAFRERAESDFIGKAKFRDLLAHEQRGQREYLCSEGLFDLSCVLGLMPKSDRLDRAEKLGLVQNIQHIHTQINIGQMNVQLIQMAQELDSNIGEFISDLKLIALDQPNGEADSLLKQMRLLRNEIAVIQDQQAKPTERKEAAETVKTVTGRLQEGLDKFNSVVKPIKDGEKHLAFVVEKGQKLWEMASPLF